MKTSYHHAAFILLATAAVALLCASPARAGTLTVNSGADSGGTCPGADCTLRQAIATSVSGDTINFSASVTKVSLTSAELLIEHELTISGPGPGLLEVTRASGGNFRIFKISNGSISGPAVSISGIAITNGHPSNDYGGGIYNSASKLSVTNCIITGNTSDFGGGGIYSDSGSLTVSNCTLSGNSASNTGGGIANFRSTMIVTNSTLSGNSVSNSFCCLIGYGGGGIFIFNAEATVSNCTLSGNSATPATQPSQGGGIFNESYNSNSTLTVRKCTLSGNTASDGGGGIANESFSNNAIATLTVSNSTLSGNGAPGGGGIYNLGKNGGNAFVKLSNSILASTSNDPGANLVNVGAGTSITSEGYNLSTDNGGGFLTAAGDQINTDPKLGPLQSNGGPTATMALLPGSPAQDKGYNFGVSTDQRGLPRPIDIASIPNAPGGDGSDIGAVEMTAIPPFIVTTTADHDDGTCSVSDCTLREAINGANAAGGANTIVFAGGVTGTITLQSGLGTLTITNSVTIVGPGARSLAVSGNSAIRVFYFSSGSSAISGLTIRDGNATAAISGNGMRGGGIFNAGNASLIISDCSLYNNHVQGANNTTVASGAGGFGDGGAICNSGNLTVSRCSLVLNSAVGGFGADASGAVGANVHGGDGGTALGAAIFNDTGGNLTLSDSTLATNIATGGAAGKGQFGGNGGLATGGVFNNGTMTVTAATLSNNGATGGAAGKGNNNFNGGSIGVARGGLATGNGTSVVRDTISAGNAGNGNAASDAGGTFSSEGYNLIGAGDASTGFNATGDQLGTSAAPVIAKLGALQNNSGNTDTFALLPGSPAIDAGKAFGLSTDQRGLGRVVGTAIVSGGDGSDIGAFEVQTPPTPGLVANVSTRLPVGTGDNVLIEGFTVQGPAGSTKKIIVRAIGPALAQFGITDALPNPTLEIHDANNNNAVVATNDDWKVTQPGGLITGDQSAEISASGFAPGNDLESAIIANLPPGSYTAVVHGAGNTVGTGVVDAYDLSPASSARLVNVATRGLIQPGDKLMIAGFITQSGLVKAVVRAVGPSLAPFGITNALADTTLQLRDGNGAIVVENDDWKIRSSDGSSQQAEIQATGLQPTDDREAAIVTTLPPGQYTAQVRGKPETTGTGVVQVYFLP